MEYTSYKQDNYLENPKHTSESVDSLENKRSGSQKQEKKTDFDLDE